MKKKSAVGNRVLAAFLAAAMVGTYLPAIPAAAAGGDGDPAVLAQFTFDDAETGFAGGSAVAKVNGTYELRDSMDAENGKALYLNGNAANYLSVTDEDGGSLLAGKEEITISYDEKPDQTGTNWAYYAAPTDGRQPLSGGERYIGAFHNSGNIKLERYKNGRSDCIEESVGTDWAHIDIVYTEKDTTLYVNGIKRETMANVNKLTDILGDTGIFYIGRANWVNGEGYKGWIDNFTIYDGALTDEDLIDEESAKAAVEADKAALTLPESVKADFTLPSAGSNHSDITWTVSENSAAVIGEDGYTVTVTRPEGEDVTVTFTAEISMGAVTETKEFTVVVEKVLTEDDYLDAAKKQLELVNPDDVRGNITLPAELAIDETNETAAITWKSSNPDVVTDTEKDGKPAGVVTRQDEDTKVTMTATIEVNGETTTKDIELTVKKAHDMGETTDYLFAYFLSDGGPSQQQIFFASSHDGNNWMDLNRKEAVLSVADSVRTQEDIDKTQNQAGVRDPFMVRSPEGDKFYLIATDLCIGSNDIANGTVDWGTSQFNGSHCLRIWESTDLVNWSEPWLAEVAPEGTTCAWAPETIYDETTGEFIVYWASMTGSVQKVYYSKTRDFRSFTEPQMFIDNGNDHVIDTTVLRDSEGNYYRGSATDGTIRMEKCTDSSQWLTNQDVWEKQGLIRDLTGYQPSLEGPELFAYNQDDWKEVDGEKVPTYGLLADNYGGVGYVPFYTTDIANAEWVKTDDNDFNFDTNHKRHGTVIPLTAEEYDRVMDAYGPAKIEVKTEPVKTEYKVDSEELLPAGLVLTVTYADDRTEDIAYNGGSKNARHFSFSDVDFTTEGTKTVTVTYGEKTAEFDIEVKDAADIEAELLLDFDFENLSANQDIITDTAKATGGYTLTGSYEGSGQALHLDGTSAQWLDVTNASGGSLLTGVEEMTVSYDIKNERTSTNWAFFAAPNRNTQLNTTEHYIGFLHNGGNLTVERYNNTNGRPANPSTSVGNDWVHIDAVFTAEDTAIYVNGVEKARVDSEYSLLDILGGSSILQIGKANWASGEYTQASIDNMKVWDKALTADELLKNVPDFFLEQELENIKASIEELVLEDGKSTLPDYNGTVTWKSDMDAVSIGEDGLTADVQAPEIGEDDLTGELTAVITLGSLTEEITVPVTVRAKVGPDDPYGYLMVHFVEDSNGYAEKMYLDISRGDNPEQWDPLNGRNPILASNLGTTGSRDPYLTYNPETETYYIIATDLRVFGGDNLQWGAWSNNYSTKMNVWESKDLITWSDVRQFDVALENGVKQENMGMMWAPEATWVPDYYGDHGAFVVYWTSQVYLDEAQTQKDGGQDIMYGVTTDFTQDTWDFGGKMLEGGSAGWIDTNILQANGKTYHITKSNSQQIIMESTEAKDWWNYDTTEWTRVQSNIGESRYGAVEGPATFTDHSQPNRWYLFVDDLPTPGYQPMVSTDLDKGWEYLDASDYFLTSYTKHGGVISLTKAQYDALRAADATSAVETDLGTAEVEEGSTEEALKEVLPQTAEVNLAYDMGTSELPVVWDLSSVDLDTPDTYEVTGVVQSISANKDAWVGKDGSTAYDAEDKVLYSSRAIEVTAQVTVKESDEPEPAPTLDDIIIEGPAKTEYVQGEELDLTGLTVTAVYSDGTSKEVTEDCTVSGYDPQKMGEQSVKVTFENITRFFTVTVTEKEEPAPEPTLTEIKVTVPEKTEYIQGEELDLTGLTVTAVYSDGTEKEITEGYTVTGYDANAAGEQTITVTYEGKTADFKVTVKKAEVPAPILTEIKVTAPEKTEYTQGEELDLTGLTVTAVYSDGTEKEITEGYTVTGYDADATGEQTITITYGGMTAEFTVTVAEKEEPEDPDQPTDPDQPGKPDDTQKPSGSTGGGQSQSGQGTQSAVKTGDTTNLLLPIAGIALAVVLAAVARKRQTR